MSIDDQISLALFADAAAFFALFVLDAIIFYRKHIKK